jgi:hypothetical protein
VHVRNEVIDAFDERRRGAAVGVVAARLNHQRGGGEAGGPAQAQKFGRHACQQRPARRFHLGHTGDLLQGLGIGGGSKHVGVVVAFGADDGLEAQHDACAALACRLEHDGGHIVQHRRWQVHLGEHEVDAGAGSVQIAFDLATVDAHRAGGDAVLDGGQVAKPR